MLSQLELLKEALQEQEAKFGPGNPFVQGLEVQIASDEKPRAENPMSVYSVGFRGGEDTPTQGPASEGLGQGKPDN